MYFNSTEHLTQGLKFSIEKFRLLHSVASISVRIELRKESESLIWEVAATTAAAWIWFCTWNSEATRSYVREEHRNYKIKKLMDFQDSTEIDVA